MSSSTRTAIMFATDDIICPKGTTCKISCSVYNENGEEITIPLSATAYIGIKRRATDETAVINQAMTLNQSLNVFETTLSVSTTNIAVGRYEFDILYSYNSEIYQIMRGVFHVIPVCATVGGG